MSIYISDCTIRDGGYLLDKNSDPVFVKGVIRGLMDAGIDYIETGFLQDHVSGESIVYRDSKDVRKYLPLENNTSEFVGFCDNSRYSVENLDDCDGKSFKSLRISFAKHEKTDALKFCSAAKDKGYHVFVQPMDAIGYTLEERAEMIHEVNRFHPEALAIVDTFGAMYMEELETIFNQMDNLLDKNIKIGLHTHNNLQLSCALAEKLISLAVQADRDVVIDGSLLGMGRGAGNAHTEIIAEYINKYIGKKYNIQILLETIKQYILPLKERIHWGYDIPMFICGTKAAHVDNIEFMKKNAAYSYEDMYNIIDSLDAAERKRYGANYSKTDFTVLENACNRYGRKQ